MTKKQKAEQEQEAFDLAQRQINADIEKGSFRPYYLIYGEETYLCRQNRRKLKQALSADGGDLNLLYVKGADADPQELINFAETMPFLAARRTIIVEDSGFFKSGCAPLEAFLKRTPASAVFVFAESAVDRRSAMYKCVADKGVVINCVTQSEKNLRTWIRYRLRTAGKDIRDPAAQSLIDRTGRDMMCLENEIDKLISYCGDRAEVTKKDMDAVCSTYLTGIIYELTDALAERNREKAMALYMKMLSLQEKPGRILYSVTRQFYQLLMIGELSARNADMDEMIKITGLQDFVIRKHIRWNTAFRTEDLREYLDMCLSNDRAVKSGRMHQLIGIEMVIAKSTR